MKYSNPAHKSYARRNRHLKKAGYQSYTEYLQSAEWKAVRKKVLTEKGSTCSFCGTLQNIQIHHLQYSKKGFIKQATNNLIPICDRCHGEITKLVRTHGVNDFQATEIYRDLYFPTQGFTGMKKNKVIKKKEQEEKNKPEKVKQEKRLLSMKIVNSSGLPETLHHSLNSTIIARRKMTPDEYMTWYEERKSKKNDQVMLGLFNENKDKVRTYLTWRLKEFEVAPPFLGG